MDAYTTTHNSEAAETLEQAEEVLNILHRTSIVFKFQETVYLHPDKVSKFSFVKVSCAQLFTGVKTGYSLERRCTKRFSARSTPT